MASRLACASAREEGLVRFWRVWVSKKSARLEVYSVCVAEGGVRGGVRAGARDPSARSTPGSSSGSSSSAHQTSPGCPT